MAKGLDEQVINQALSSLDEEQVQERMEKVLSVKHKSLKNDPKVREKLIRFGLSRGYAYDELSDCVHHLLTR
jgi:SOS response regulatory protein OraA/RecX